MRGPSLSRVTTEDRAGRTRLLFGAGAAAALVVALVFATVGDGVGRGEADGVRGLVVEHGHTLVWVLLTAALAIAALQRRWGRLSQVLAVGAGGAYAAFLGAVFLDL